VRIAAALLILLGGCATTPRAPAPADSFFAGLRSLCGRAYEGRVVTTDAADADIRRIAVELVRSGGVRGLFLPQLAANAFDGFVIDRLRGPDGGPRIYLRPKVPFGAPRARG